MRLRTPSSQFFTAITGNEIARVFPPTGRDFSPLAFFADQTRLPAQPENKTAAERNKRASFCVCNASKRDALNIVVGKVDARRVEIDTLSTKIKKISPGPRASF